MSNDAAAHAQLRLVVCGGRDYTNLSRVMDVLTAIHKKRGISEIIHGGAKGADSFAEKWASIHGVNVTSVKADWDKHGRAAGPIRNQAMLDLQPDGVVAFPGGVGTAHMVRIAEAAGIKVMRVTANATSKDAAASCSSTDPLSTTEAPAK